MNVFVIESPNPYDLLDGRNEADSLVNICKMFGHKAVSFFVKNRMEFQSAIKYVADVEAKSGDLFCYHLSCHGNDSGVAFGPDFLDWEKLAISIIPILENTSLKNKSIMIISACGANEQELTGKISGLDEKAKSSIAPPSYIFVYDESEVKWNDALLSWAILYHKLGKVRKIDKSEIQELLKGMDLLEFGKLIYFRWDENKQKYLRFKPNDN